MHDSDSKQGRSLAEERFHSWLAEREEGSSSGLEELCSAHPENSSVFKELYQKWEGARRLLDLGVGAAETLSVDLGKLVDEVVEVRKEGGARGSSETTNEEVHRELRERLDPATRLEVKGEVARGGMGAVLSVFDKNLRREMAMKVMLKQSEAQSEGSTRAMSRFLDEAQITGQLEHPGIVPVHELGIDADGRVYFTMKLVQGEELASVYKRAWAEDDGWSVTRVLGLFLRVCEAMAYAHSRGVIHRDLKPANVMVGSFGEVYVMDWGLARIHGQEDAVEDDLAPDKEAELVQSDREDLRGQSPDSSFMTMQGDIMGTPAYMAPEQARGAIAEMDERSDVYAIGAMLYELLAGRRPYSTLEENPNLIALLNMIREGSPLPVHEFHPEVPPELEAICEKAMSHEKAGRYRDVGELGEDLRNYLEGRVVAAYETGALAELKKWVRRNRGLSNSLAAGVLVLLAGVFVSTFFWREASNQAQSVLRLGDSRDLHSLWVDARDLWPARPERARDMSRWLDRAGVLLSRLPEHREVLASLSVEALPRTEEEIEEDKKNHPLAASLEQYRAAIPSIKEAIDSGPESEDADYWRGKLKEYEPIIAELEEAVSERVTYNFEDQNKGWWHGALTQLIQKLELLEAQDYWLNQDKELGFVTGIKEMQRRIKDAESLEEESFGSEEASALWKEAVRSISDETECPMYAGLELAPQLGLLPIGRDPSSGLWEFTHVQSRVGSRVPSRDPNSGELQLDRRHGLSFVLIPGGRFLMGAQAEDPSAPNYYPEAMPKEGPVHEVELAPFFLSKYEMTQEQFARAGYQRPSLYPAGTKIGLDPASGEVMNEISQLNPVESVTWEESAYICRVLDLALPTEAQWEYAARAGTTTPWWTGADGSGLQGAENLGDQSTQVIGQPAWTYEDWTDGFPAHSPVNAMRPNPWGLYQILGNVGEWTAEVYQEGYLQPATGPEGWHVQTDPASDESRTIRGPGWFRTREGYRVSARYAADPKNYKTEHFGLRPVRPLR